MKQRKKILLLSPNYKKGYMRNGRCDFIGLSGTQWYPILLGYLGAYLESQGHTVLLVDAQAYNLTDEQTGKIYKNFKPDYSCVYAGNESFEFDLFLNRKINAEICPSKLIGPFYALNADKYTEAGIRGGLELGVQDWVEGRADGKNIITGQPLPTHKLDKMPFVSTFFMKRLHPKYYRTPSEPWPFVDIFTGRGCYWGECTFCLWPKVYGKGYHVRSIENVVEELREIQRNKFYKSVMIQDDTLPEDRARALSDAIIRAEIKIRWSCYSRACLTYDTMRLMKKAGCLNLHVGYESGVDDTLRRICKGISVELMESFTKSAKRAGLRIHGDFLIGIDETPEEVKKTIDFACKIRPTTAQFQVHIPYFGEPMPGTKQEVCRYYARYAYRRFYLNPKSWPAVARQIWKPAILRQSIKTLLGVKG